MSYPPGQKPPQWSIDSGVVAYNASRLGLPIPAGLWAMWEKGGNKIYDLSGNNNNSDAFAGTTAWKTGESGSCLDFPGLNNWANIPHSSSIDMDGIGTVTIITGIRLYGWGENNQGRIVDKDGGTAARSHGYTFFPHILSNNLIGDPVFAVNATDLNWNMNGSAGFFELNKDIIVAVSWDKDSHCRFFKDGIFHSAAVSYHTSAINGSGAVYPCRIGVRPDGTRELDGRIYFLYVFNEAFTDQQIAQLSANPYGLIADPYQIETLGFVAAAGGISIPVVMNHIMQARNN